MIAWHVQGQKGAAVFQSTSQGDIYNCNFTNNAADNGKILSTRGMPRPVRLGMAVLLLVLQSSELPSCFIHHAWQPKMSVAAESAGCTGGAIYRSNPTGPAAISWSIFMSNQ